MDGRNEVVQALAGLPLTQRRVVMLRRLLDLTESETARELGILVGTVTSYLALAPVGPLSVPGLGTVSVPGVAAIRSMVSGLIRVR